ncbi:MAG: bacteriohemerythrin [Deferribacteraceae bacterium]|jgi:hemerythrin-like metal-binding protein|nr:bacteriohemerythrin [Deferribacteraceae bacterium]
MAEVQWSDTLSVKIELFDNEHKQLIAIINNLYSAQQQGRTLEAIAKTINELSGYAKTHFKHEEEYLEQINSPELNLQQEQHAAFIAKIDEFQSRYDEGTMFSAISMLAYLSSWLVNHIQKVDSLYGKK